MLAEYLSRLSRTAPVRYAETPGLTQAYELPNWPHGLPPILGPVAPALLLARSLLSANYAPNLMFNFGRDGAPALPPHILAAYHRLIHPAGTTDDAADYLQGMMGGWPGRELSRPVGYYEEIPWMRNLLVKLRGGLPPRLERALSPSASAMMGDEAALRRLLPYYGQRPDDPMNHLPGFRHLLGPAAATPYPATTDLQHGLDTQQLAQLIDQAVSTGDLHALAMAHHHLLHGMGNTMASRHIGSMLSGPIQEALRANLGVRLTSAGQKGLMRPDWNEQLAAAEERQRLLAQR